MCVCVSVSVVIQNVIITETTTEVNYLIFVLASVQSLTVWPAFSSMGFDLIFPLCLSLGPM